MIKVLRDGDTYYITNPKAVIIGNVYRIIYAMRQIGITYRAIEIGLLALEKHNHQVAEYDKRGNFVKTRLAE